MKTQISSQSKRITKKGKKSNKRPQKKDKKYFTVKKEKKFALIAFYKKELERISKNKPDAKKELDEINKALIRALKKYTEITNFSVETLRAWRRKLKSWASSPEKVETRGGALVSFAGKAKIDFDDELKKAIISHGKWSYIDAFRQKIRSILQKYRNKKVPENSCSKHWFYDYLKKNNEVKETWENVFGQTLPDEGAFMTQIPEMTTDENFVDLIEEEEEEEREEISVMPLTTITYEKVKIQVKMEEEDERQSVSTAPSECEHLVHDYNFQRDFTPADVSQCQFRLPQSFY